MQGFKIDAMTALVVIVAVGFIVTVLASHNIDEAQYTTSHSAAERIVSFQQKNDTPAIKM